MNTTHPLCREFVLWRVAALMLIVCLGWFTGVSNAEEPDPAGRVARISYLLGNVYVQTDEGRDWTPAGINQPLTSGDALRTDSRARSELQLGSATIQIDDNTELALNELSDEALQLNLHAGAVSVRVRDRDEQDSVQVTTPAAAIAVREPGTYRIDVDDQQTIVQVRDGSVDVEGAHQHFVLHAGEQMRLSGGKRVAAEFDSLSGMDEFDRWAAERNQRAARAVSTRYVANDVIGYEDLDDYGDWSWYADYGYVWTPRNVYAGWAPYRSGRWAWIDPWGWTWIDTAPWGFAPFHYGRWATVRNRWCWVPGPRTVRPVYAPALVAWVGRPGVNVSVHVGAQPVGWIPLGPREVYRPIYHTSQNYLIKVNMGSSQFNHDELERDIHRQPHEDQYRNRAATSIVPADALRNAQPVNHQLMQQNGLPLHPINSPPFHSPSRDHDGGGAMEPTAEPTLRQRSIVTSPYVRPAEARPENAPGTPAPLEHRSNPMPQLQEPPANRPQFHRGMPVPPPQNTPANTPQPERSPPRPWSGNQGHQGGGQPRFESPTQPERALPAPGNVERSPNREDRGGNRQRLQGDVR